MIEGIAWGYLAYRSAIDIEAFEKIVVGDALFVFGDRWVDPNEVVGAHESRSQFRRGHAIEG